MRPCSWDAGSFARSLAMALEEEEQQEQEEDDDAVPEEFLCPLSGRLMAEPAVVSSGASYERRCMQAWLAAGRSDCMRTGAELQPALLLPNLALEQAIRRWCRRRRCQVAAPPTRADAEAAVARLLLQQQQQQSDPSPNSGVVSAEAIAARLTSSRGDDVAGAAADVRRLSSAEGNPGELCTPAVLAALLPLLHQRRGGGGGGAATAVNALAAVANLAAPAANKVAVARAGVMPVLVHLLRAATESKSESEVADLAATALMRLAVAEENRVALGVLGAMPPLVAALRRGGDGGGGAWPQRRRDALNAVYYLSQAAINRGRVVKAGGVDPLLAAAEAECENEEIGRRAMQVVAWVAATEEGRAAVAAAEGVERIVAALQRRRVLREEGVAALVELSRRNLRFRRQAIGGIEALVGMLAEGEGREKLAALLAALREGPHSAPPSLLSPSSSMSSSSSYPGRAYVSRLERPPKKAESSQF